MATPSPLALARRLVRRTTGPPIADADAADAVPFRCNLCGSDNLVPVQSIARETPSCADCRSTVRLRAMAHLVVREALRIDAAICDLAPRREVAGIGLSDDPCCAQPLAAVFDYQNTYLHRHPRLDVTAVPRERRARYDFVIASDVFEHVPPPVARAFDGARALLRPGGVLIFSVPFTLDADTVEHYPELHDWHIEHRGGGWLLHNTTAGGRTQVFDDLAFHGGEGSTLEMRVFSRAALERHIHDAGFAHLRIADEACPAFGIAWPEPWSVPMVAYAA